jgi:hypothetical protein
MSDHDWRDAYPRQIRHSTAQPGLLFERSATLYAKNGEPAHRSDGVPVLALTTDTGEPITVYEERPEEPGAIQAEDAIAVYVDPASGRILVPTGRVFVRFNESIAADAMRAPLQEAGYRIVSVPDYARHTAWLEATSGGASRGLADIARLEGLPGVENVEPQLLSLRAAR